MARAAPGIQEKVPGWPATVCSIISGKKFAEGSFAPLDTLLKELDQSATEETQKKVSLFIYNQLGGAAKYALRQLEAEALKAEAELKDYHATLIFTLIKKYDFGYAVLSFGVGIALSVFGMTTGLWLT